MKVIKKVIIIFFLILAVYYGFLIYKKGYKYDANDPKKSIELMVRMTDPLKRAEFLFKFNQACQDFSCTNLHGLTKKEIYEIADKK